MDTTTILIITVVLIVIIALIIYFLKKNEHYSEVCNYKSNGQYFMKTETNLVGLDPIDVNEFTVIYSKMMYQYEDTDNVKCDNGECYTITFKKNPVLTFNKNDWYRLVDGKKNTDLKYYYSKWINDDFLIAFVNPNTGVQYNFYFNRDNNNVIAERPFFIKKISDGVQNKAYLERYNRILNNITYN
jgi:uncharacterized protein YpmB